MSNTETFITWFSGYRGNMRTVHQWRPIIDRIEETWGKVAIHEWDRDLTVISFEVTDAGNEIEFGNTFRSFIREHTAYFPDDASWLAPVALSRDQSRWMKEEQLVRVNKVKEALGSADNNSVAVD